jgi:hypothetical protein
VFKINNPKYMLRKLAIWPTAVLIIYSVKSNFMLHFLSYLP